VNELVGGDDSGRGVATPPGRENASPSVIFKTQYCGYVLAGKCLGIAGRDQGQPE
jgi:hypothetical protein